MITLEKVRQARAQFGRARAEVSNKIAEAAELGWDFVEIRLDERYAPHVLMKMADLLENNGFKLLREPGEGKLTVYWDDEWLAKREYQRRWDEIRAAAADDQKL